MGRQKLPNEIARLNQPCYFNYFANSQAGCLVIAIVRNNVLTALEQ